MKFSAALALAWQKIRHRKVRAVLVVLTLSIGTTIVLALTFASSGFLKLVNDLFPDTTAGHFFAVEVLSKEAQADLDQADYEKKLAEFKPESVKTQTLFGAGRFGLKGVLDEPSDFLELRSLDEVFARDFVLPDQPYEVQGGVVPIIVPRAALLELLNEDYAKLSQSEQYELTQQVVDTYVGQRYELLLSKAPTTVDGKAGPAETTNVTVQIVGVAVPSFFSSRDLTLVSEAMLVPPAALAKDAPLEDFLSEKDEFTQIIEFADKDLRGAFVAARTPKVSPGSINFEDFLVGAQPLDSRYEALTGLGSIARKVGYGVGGFFIALSALLVLLTLGKEVSESRREIAVYRAVGATRRDIRTIVSTFATSLVVIGFAVGFGFAIGVAALASRFWGEQVFYFLANLGTGIAVDEPRYMFVSLEWVAIAVLFGATLIIGLGASLLPAYRATRIDPVRVLKDE